MRTILPVFYSEGRVPDDRDRFRSLVRLGAILEAQAFIILAEIEST